MGASIVMFVICTLCGGIFFSIGQWAQRSSKPMHFYSGTTVSPDEIRDIPAYNRENARMWKIYSLPYFGAAILGIRNPGLSAVLIGVACLPGIIVLVSAYQRIYRKYAVKP